MKNEHPVSLTNHADRGLDLDKCSIQADELGSADTVIMLMITVTSILYEGPYLMQSRSLGTHLRSLNFDRKIRDAAFH